VKEETLEKNILEQAKKYKSRVKENPESQRHDIVKPDEMKTMYTAYAKLGWSHAKIGGVFKRDPRTVMRCIQKEQTNLTKRKENQQKIKQHFQELSVTALILASNFESYLNAPGTDSDFIGKNRRCGGRWMAKCGRWGT
jgi:hypothetical protein